MELPDSTGIQSNLAVFFSGCKNPYRRPPFVAFRGENGAAVEAGRCRDALVGLATGEKAPAAVKMPRPARFCETGLRDPIGHSFFFYSEVTRMPSFFQVIFFREITALPSASIFDLKQFLFLFFFIRF